MMPATRGVLILMAAAAVFGCAALQDAICGVNLQFEFCHQEQPESGSSGEIE